MALVDHHAGDLLGQEEGGLEVDVQDSVPVVHGVGEEVAGAAGDAGVVVEDVDAAEALDGGCDQPIEVGQVRDVGLDGQRTAAGRLDLAGGLLGQLGAQVGDDDAGALLREAQRNRAPDAPGGARDDRDLVGQTHRCLLITWGHRSPVLGSDSLTLAVRSARDQPRNENSP